MNCTHRVSDVRTNKTLFAGCSVVECVAWISNNVSEDDELFAHIRIEPITNKRQMNPMTTETNAERLEKVKNLQNAYYSKWNSEDEPNRLGRLVLGHLDWLIQQAERAQELEKTLAQRESFIDTLHAVHFKELQGEKAENARLREALSEQSTTVHVIKRRNGKATIIGWNGERYVYQSESSARGGVSSGKR